MRFVLLLLLSFFAAVSAQAQSTTSPCTTFGPGSPSCPYQWVGATSVAFTGDGNGLGFVGMTTQCRADFGPGARMCRSEEILHSDTLNLNAIPAAGCWVQPTVVAGSQNGPGDASGLLGNGVDLSCTGWSSNTNYLGLVITAAGAFGRVACAPSRPVACCKPIAVGEPQASMMLPTGVGMLAMLSMMKGGA